MNGKARKSGEPLRRNRLRILKVVRFVRFFHAMLIVWLKSHKGASGGLFHIDTSFRAEARPFPGRALVYYGGPLRAPRKGVA